jgi:ketosteroid isomerase-like protein
MTLAHTNEARIRKGAEDFARALYDKDPDRVLAHYAPQVRIFDLAPPLQFEGAAAARRDTLVAWFATWDGPIRCETRDLQIEIGGDLAVAHSLDHMSGTKTNGEKPDLWFRTTVAYRKIDGDWRVTHVHESVPFDMTTFQALLDLRP